MITPTVTATARDAGRNVLHTVSAGENPVISANRRSAHRYNYAICRWSTNNYGERVVIVLRWSRSSHTTGRDFAVPIMRTETIPDEEPVDDGPFDGESPEDYYCDDRERDERALEDQAP